jgi:ABC-type xylose transport system permease subunit
VARERRVHRLDKPPTWRSAFNRAVISAAIFAVAVVLLFKRPVSSAVILGAAMVVLYLPMSYYTDRFLYNRRRKRQGAG